MIEALGALEPGISNSVTNVRFEHSVAKIAQLKQQIASKIPFTIDAEKLIAMEVENARHAFEILNAGSEGKALLENRLQRVIAQGSLSR